MSPETVVEKPSLTRVPVAFPPVPVTYVANAPISNSLGLKYSGGGGAGVITCFEDTTGSPAKATTACDARVTTAKANFFIRVVFKLSAFSLSIRLRQGRRGHRIAVLEGKSIKFNQTFLLHLSTIGSTDSSFVRAVKKGRLKPFMRLEMTPRSAPRSQRSRHRWPAIRGYSLCD